MKINDKQKFQVIYFQITDLWQRFCEEHNNLFDMTCDEYSALLKNNIIEVEIITEKKQAIIEYISELDGIRSDIIKELDTIIEDGEINSVSDLLNVMLQFEAEEKQKHLSSFNAFLIDIIEKIQKQNKKNQIFINKAMHSLSEIRNEIMGTKKCETYNSKGITNNRV